MLHSVTLCLGSPDMCLWFHNPEGQAAGLGTMDCYCCLLFSIVIFQIKGPLHTVTFECDKLGICHVTAKGGRNPAKALPLAPVQLVPSAGQVSV